MTDPLPTLAQAKSQAKQLRADLAAQGREIGHARALEVIARQHGYRDWNTFHAAIADRAPDGWTPGGRVAGEYLSQPFEATVIEVIRCVSVVAPREMDTVPLLTDTTPSASAPVIPGAMTVIAVPYGWW